jgi:CMP-N,N'-diacetyllegionaminic acid synthase
MNASVYVWRRSALLEKDSVITPHTGLYVMPEERSIDIDSELDFQIVEFLMERGTVR